MKLKVLAYLKLATDEVLAVPSLKEYYDFIGYFLEGLAVVKLNDQYGFIDKTYKEVVPLKYDSVGYFSDGLAAVLLKGKFGFVDKTGREYWNMTKVEALEQMKP